MEQQPVIPHVPGVEAGIDKDPNFIEYLQTLLGTQLDCEARTHLPNPQYRFVPFMDPKTGKPVLRAARLSELSDGSLIEQSLVFYVDVTSKGDINLVRIADDRLYSFAVPNEQLGPMRLLMALGRLRTIQNN
ncbi:hypothetical protein HY441_00320 [Candidatus Microgenomates bacterium]|nr:hypothetical protein [Candidatus Microgenomates bacterium]